MGLVELATARLRARQHANQETNDESSSFVSKDELNSFLNEDFASLYDKLVKAYPQEYNITKADLASVQPVIDQLEYNLPDDFYRLVSYTLQDGEDFFQPEIWQFHELGELLRAEYLNQGYTIRNLKYRLQNNTLVLRPPPKKSTWFAHMFYIPTFTPLVADDDEFDGVNGWEEWAIIKSAIKMKAKAKFDIGALTGLWQSVDERLNGLIKTRDQSQPQQMNDVMGTSEYRLSHRYGR